MTIIRRGHLHKRSQGKKGDWKRRFFVLDSQGMLYYYSHKVGFRVQRLGWDLKSWHRHKHSQGKEWMAECVEGLLDAECRLLHRLKLWSPDFHCCWSAPARAVCPPDLS